MTDGLTIHSILFYIRLPTVRNSAGNCLTDEEEMLCLRLLFVQENPDTKVYVPRDGTAIKNILRRTKI